MVQQKLPIITKRSKKISFLSISTHCQGYSTTSAPQCDWIVTLQFCAVDNDSNCKPNTSRSGSFNASGMTSAAYRVSGGTGSFNNASGDIDTVFIQTDKSLDKGKIEICYEK